MPQCGGPNQGYITVQYQQGVIVSDKGHDLIDGMTSAQLWFLQHPVHRFMVKRLAYPLSDVAIDHVNAPWLKLLCSSDDVLEEGGSTQWMQDLG